MGCYTESVALWTLARAALSSLPCRLLQITSLKSEKAESAGKTEVTLMYPNHRSDIPLFFLYYIDYKIVASLGHTQEEKNTQGLKYQVAKVMEKHLSFCPPQ